jgi:photosystem II stability/assembly factor-like uncharacterized protein
VTCRRSRLWLGLEVAAALMCCALAGPAPAQGLDTPAAAQRALKQPQRPAARAERAALMSITRAGSRLVTVGEHGVIAWSDDNGLHWQAAQSHTDATLTQVRFADPLNGWAVGHLGLVLHTGDGGKTWRQQLDGNQAAQLALKQAQALSGTAGTAALAAAERGVSDGPDKPWLDLWVGEGGQVIVVGAFNTALHSRDGGRSWASFAHALPNPGAYHLYAVAAAAGVAAAGPQLLVAGEQGLLMKGSWLPGSGEPSFQALQAPYQGSFFAAAVLDEQTYLVLGLRGNVLRSTDGGASWQAVQIPNATASFNSAAVIAPGQVALCDQAGRVYLSTDAGQHFRLLPSGGAPATGLVRSADGGLVLATLGGIVKLPAAALQASPQDALTPSHR